MEDQIMISESSSEERAGSSQSALTTLISGVVEGFYGRPWTQEQRSHLFVRLKCLGMNTYLYAPKDDVKHRAEWRVLYTEDETEILRQLIHSARESDIRFVYAISPGLDIVYSKKEEMETLKEKLDQVRHMGCESFALLFDDIETEMQECDQLVFSTFAAAQVAVTNMIHAHLGKPLFFFCPTEYCESRARPTLEESEYLGTVGRDLQKEIHVMWTGPRVVSSSITVGHIQAVARVIQRKPLLWDNLHANDYDPKRVFLGPFAARPVILKDEISGLLLNPNCKYEANFIPIHTMAQWFRAQKDAVENASCMLEAFCPTLMPDRMEEDAFYHPNWALKKAISDWCLEFDSSNGPSIPPIPRVDSDAILKPIARRPSAAEPSLALEDIIQSVVDPSNHTQQEPINSLSTDYVEPMDQGFCSVESQSTISSSEEKAMDSASKDTCSGTSLLEEGELATFVDLFFLPFCSGRKGLQIMEVLSWLIENAHVMSEENCIVDSDREEWRTRQLELENVVEQISKFFAFIIDCKNKTLMSELIAYVWEVHGTMSAMMAISRWMTLGYINVPAKQRARPWEQLVDGEPWSIHGGFVQDIHRILAPNNQILAILGSRGFLPLSITNYAINPMNLNNLLGLSRLACDEPDLSSEPTFLNANIFIDRFVRPFARVNAVHNFVVQYVGAERNQEVLCFVCAHSNAQEFYADVVNYKEEIKASYREKTDDDSDSARFETEVDSWFPGVNNEIMETYPAVMDARFRVDADEAVPAKKMIHALAISLAYKGVSGLFTTVPVNEVERVHFYMRIGFCDAGMTADEKSFVLGLHLDEMDKEDGEMSRGSDEQEQTSKEMQEEAIDSEL